MCGIVGYVGDQQAIPILIRGLEHLEYRGYDSAGIACLEAKSRGFFVAKEKGKLSSLKACLNGKTVSSHIGIGHTRWATHGEPSKLNAHPHLDDQGRIALVHNGIIENFSELKSELKRKGFKFRSETDTEVAVNLISSYYRGDLLTALRQALARMHGFFAFAMVNHEDPNTLIVFKRSNPLVIGLGKKGNFIASDASALLPHTNKIIFLGDEEYALVQKNKVSIYNLKGKKVTRNPVKIHWNVEQAQKTGYPHFMLKEIYEQPVIMQETLSKRLDARGQIHFDTLDKKRNKKLKEIKKVYFVSCGTAFHAGLIGSYLMEKLAHLPAEARVSSEFRYGNPILSNKDLVVLITQSGETADTLAALREAKTKGALTLAIVNVVGSAVAREADAVLYTHAGPEIGVASTKAYTAQLLTLILWTHYMDKLKKNSNREAFFFEELRKLPDYCKKVLRLNDKIKREAKKFFHCKNFLYLGRGYHFATALEGALKLKEISYAHAHGYAAGEMKHGPIALIDHKQPVICIAPDSQTYEKMISNIEEIKARKGIVLSIGSRGDDRLARISDVFFETPKTLEVFTPILAVLPLQLFAYYIAVLNKRDVDQPRNLAKSVTVE